jgi:hypothetical protein
MTMPWSPSRDPRAPRIAADLERRQGAADVFGHDVEHERLRAQMAWEDVMELATARALQSASRSRTTSPEQFDGRLPVAGADQQHDQTLSVYGPRRLAVMAAAL